MNRVVRRGMPLEYHPLAAAVLRVFGHDSTDWKNGTHLTLLAVLEEDPYGEDGLEGEGLEIVHRWRAAGCPYAGKESIHPAFLDVGVLLRDLDEDGALDDCYFGMAEQGDTYDEEPLQEAITRWRGAGYAIWGVEGGRVGRTRLGMLLEED